MTPEDIQTSQAHKVLEFMEANGISKDVLHHIIKPKPQVRVLFGQKMVEDPVRDKIFYLYEEKSTIKEIVRQTGRSEGSIRGVIQRGLNHGLIQKRPMYGDYRKTAFSKEVAA